jgi:hypothetical protein
MSRHYLYGISEMFSVGAEEKQNKTKQNKTKQNKTHKTEWLKKSDTSSVKQKFNICNKDHLWCYLPLLLSPYISKSPLSKQQHHRHHQHLQYHLPAHLLHFILQQGGASFEAAYPNCLQISKKPFA